VIGFAYGQCFNRLPAYQWSVQTGIYVADGHHRCGGGRLLYTRLLQRLGDRGYRRALAGITQPNEASNDFHRAMGFRDAALYRRVEWKHGRWHDVAWMQRDLPGGGDNDDPPGSLV
jgi:L-amino acid N-acyltransferase YncA